jgi:hypothetical protein
MCQRSVGGVILTGEDRSAYGKIVRHKSHMGWPGIEPPFPSKTPPSNCPSHAAAWKEVVLAYLIGGNSFIHYSV